MSLVDNDAKEPLNRAPSMEGAMQNIERTFSNAGSQKPETLNHSNRDDSQLVSEDENKSDAKAPQPPSAAEPEKDKDGSKKAEEPPRSAEQKQASLKYVMGYAKKETGAFLLGIFFLLAGSLSDFVVPLYIGFVIDALTIENYDIVGSYCLQLFLIVLFSGVAVGLRAATFNIMSERIALNLRHDFYQSVVGKDIAFFDERRTGELLSRLNSDVQVIQDVLSTNVSMFVRGAVFIIATLCVLMIISPILTCTTFAAIIPICTFSIFYGRYIRKLQRNIQKAKADMTTVAEESFSNVRTVKAFSNEAEECSRFNEGNTIVYNYGVIKAKWAGLFSFVVQVLLYGAMAGVIYMASVQYENGKISIGQITSFLFYMIMLLFNFTMVAMVFGNVMSILGASDKIVEIMDYEPKINIEGGDKMEENEVGGVLELRNVKFSYPSKTDVEVLKGVSLKVDNNKNRVVALCGTSGCGKSSIISMIERFYDPTEGEVLFNGKNIRDLEPRWYKERIAIVQQEPVLFSGTIGENIIYGLNMEGKTQSEIEEMLDEATKQANAYNFVHDDQLFPLGYQTVVGERGVKLSGGQKQRIAIARALIRKPKILLLDEATSALDAESEYQVQQALDMLIKSGKQTVVVVAHRLSTIRDADEIIVMQKGEIKERGTHNDLLMLNGVYKNLVSRQLVSDQAQDEDVPKE